MSAIRWTVVSEVQTKPVQWLWEGRIPYAKVTLLDGEPGTGKSLLAIDLAARVSNGTAMPLSRLKPGPAANVVIFNDDDNLADTIRPRLEAAGGELSRIRCVTGEFSAAEVLEIRPALIIVDPLSVYLSFESETPTRQVLKSITNLAKETGAAVLAVQHLPKSGMWASDVYDVARSALLISTIGHGRQRIALTKSNLKSLMDVPPLVYHIEGKDSGVHLAGWADSI